MKSKWNQPRCEENKSNVAEIAASEVSGACPIGEQENAVSQSKN
jgi:hypothetical protein